MARFNLYQMGFGGPPRWMPRAVWTYGRAWRRAATAVCVASWCVAAFLIVSLIWFNSWILSRTTPGIPIYLTIVFLLAASRRPIAKRWAQSFSAHLKMYRGRVCLNCAYPLEGLPEAHVCPECATPYEMRETLEAWRRWLVAASEHGFPVSDFDGTAGP